MTAHDLIAWSRWAADGKDVTDRSARTARVQRHVFPPDLDEEEIKRRQELVAYVKNIGEPPSWEGWPESRAPSDEEVVLHVTPPVVEPARELKWEGLISPRSAAHKRASQRDKTQEGVDRMRDLSRGSPFDADEDV